MVYKVLNNFHIRYNILSYLRNSEYKICEICSIVCKWNNKRIENKFIEFNNRITCFICFKERFFGRKKLKI
jgi:hypothetical protein